MSKATFLLAGIAIGVVLAKQIENNPEAKKTLGNAATKVKDFANAVSAGYKENEAKSSAPIKSAAKRTTTTKRSR
jgi:hypothetical protein